MHSVVSCGDTAWMRFLSGIFALLIAVVACLAPAGSVVAATKPTNAVRDVVVTPKSPKASQTVTVSFTAGELPRDRRYDVALRSADAAGCSGGYSVRLTAVSKGRRVTVRFNPRDGRAVGLDRTVPRRFCAGVANAVISHVGAANRLVVLARKKFQITPVGGPETFGTPARITVLDGSTITVKAPGRPDRSNALGGLVRGFIAGPFRPYTNIDVGTLSGGFWLRSLQVDSICSGSGIVTDYPVVPAAASQLLLKASGEATFTLALKPDAASLAGCASAGAGPTALTLTGKTTADGLVKLPLTGSISGVTIGPGALATLTFNLLLNVDLSGRP